jgi:hypothetical protein
MRDSDRFSRYTYTSSSLKATGLFFASFSLASTLALSNTQDKAPPVKVQETEAKIKKLIAELGDNDFKVREIATKELEGIGLPALEALQEAEEKSDLETQKRAAPLVKGIRAANKLPISSRGLQFTLKLHPEFTIVTSDMRVVDLRYRLEITNIVHQPRRVLISDSIRAYIKTPTGDQLRLTEDHTPVLLRDSSGRPMIDRCSPLLKKGETFVLQCDATLWTRAGGQEPSYFLRGPGLDAGALHPVARFPAGVYFFSVIFANHGNPDGDVQDIWVGTAETVSEKIVIE